MTVIQHELLRATVICDRNATSAAIELRMPAPDGGMVEIDATGSAKREAGDQFVPETGAAFATARALRSAAEALEATAWEQVRAAEKAAIDARAEREKDKCVKALPRPELKTSEVQRKYGKDAAKLHLDRKRARKTAAIVEARNA
jgi:hypothetical protein